MVKSVSIFVREKTWGGIREGLASRAALALSEQDSEAKWAGSMLGHRAACSAPWGPQATVGSRGRPAQHSSCVLSLARADRGRRGCGTNMVTSSESQWGPWSAAVLVVGAHSPGCPGRLLK